MNKSIRRQIFTALAITASAVVSAQPTDLGTLGGRSSSPSAINEAGEVTGRSDLPGRRNYKAFRWTKATGMVALDSDGNSDANFINSSGDIFGQSFSGNVWTATRWAPDNTQTFLPDQTFVRTNLSARQGVEDGVVTGTGLRNDRRVGFVWDTNTGDVEILDFGSAGFDGPTFPSTKNSQGVVVGRYVFDGVTYGFRWTKDDGMTNLGSLGGDYTNAFNVNTAGIIAGLSERADGTYSVFVWTADDGMIDVLGSVPNLHSASYNPSEINLEEDGAIAGSYRTDGNNFNRAFYWTPSDGFTDITPPGADRAHAVSSQAGSVAVLATFGIGSTPYVWSRADGLISIPTLGGLYSYVAHTNSGSLAGASDLMNDAGTHAIEWTPSTGTVDLGTLAPAGSLYSYSEARSGPKTSTTSGKIVGQSETETGTHAVIFNDTDDIDTTSPVITLLGDANLAQECATGFNDPGATAIDEVDGDITSMIVVTGSVDEATPGRYTLTYTVVDAAGNEASVSREVTVADTTAPRVSSIIPKPASLWPPNHKFVAINAGYTATDSCSAAVTCALAVTSNEAANSKGDGNTDSDWLIYTDSELDLRAERSGKGDGRIYGLTASCTDASGNTASGSGEVTVAKGKGKGKN